MDDDLLIVIVVIVATFFSLQKEIIRQHNSILTGNLRYWEVVSHENPQYFFNQCGMTKPVFLLLLRKLTSEMGQLCDGTKIGAGQKIMIFLSIIRGNTYRDTSCVDRDRYLIAYTK